MSQDQQDALDSAKRKAQHITGFLPTNTAIGQAALAAFCEKYGVMYPEPKRKHRPKEARR